MLNNVVLIGRLVRDPELRYTQNGTALCKFSVAVGREFTNREGKRETDFFDIITWQKLAETCGNHLAKGRLVALRGHLQTRAYEDSGGQKHKTVEVVAEAVRFLDWPKESQFNAGEQDGRFGAEDDLSFQGGR